MPCYAMLYHAMLCHAIIRYATCSSMLYHNVYIYSQSYVQYSLCIAALLALYQQLLLLAAKQFCSLRQDRIL